MKFFRTRAYNPEGYLEDFLIKPHFETLRFLASIVSQPMKTYSIKVILPGFSPMTWLRVRKKSMAKSHFKISSNCINFLKPWVVSSFPWKIQKIFWNHFRVILSIIKLKFIRIYHHFFHIVKDKWRTSIQFRIEHCLEFWPFSVDVYIIVNVRMLIRKPLATLLIA